MSTASLVNWQPMKLDRFKPLTPDDKDRVYQEIIDNCELMTKGGCWLYRGALTPNGYATKYIQGQMRLVGRFMLCYKTRESMNINADACHGRPGSPCTNPEADDCTDGPDCPRSCVNPDHLFWGSHSDNCRERESTSFRFGYNARKFRGSTRSLATTQTPVYSAPQLSAMLS